MPLKKVEMMSNTVKQGDNDAITYKMHMKKEIDILRKDKEKLKRHWYLMKTENEALKKDFTMSRIIKDDLIGKLEVCKTEQEANKKEINEVKIDNASMKNYSIHLERCINFLKSQNPALRGDVITLEPETGVKVESREGV